MNCKQVVKNLPFIKDENIYLILNNNAVRIQIHQ
jgi:hypothetical protein